MGVKNDLCTKFYDIDNLVTIKVTIPDAEWQALKAAEPRGGRCNFQYVGDRFDWYKATSVTVSGSKFPPAAATFATVGIIKKSYCGSFSKTKPSLRLDFAKYVNANEAGVENLIGTKSLTLNNCVQDPSYIRQPLGYEILRQGRLPFARCNFAKVMVNGVDVGTFVNLEPIKKRFLENNFNNEKGNTYEIEVGEDIVPSVVSSGRISFEGFSDFKDEKDLAVAAQKMAAGGIAGAQAVVNMDSFVRFFALESLLKHWDGYTANTNNTYVYNNTVVVANPAPANVKLEFIACGIDQILQDGRAFQIGSGSSLSRLIIADATWNAKLNAAIRAYADTIFSPDNHRLSITPYVDRMTAMLSAAGAINPSVTSAIASVRKQLRLVRSGAYQLIDEWPVQAFTWRSKANDDVLHASSSELINDGPMRGRPHREVYHCPLQLGNRAELWRAAKYVAANGRDGWVVKFQNDGLQVFLHCDTIAKVLGGRFDVYAVTTDLDGGNEFYPTMQGSSGLRKATGYWILQNVATKQYVCLSETDLTPKGRKNVVQAGSATDSSQATPLYLF